MLNFNTAEQQPVHDLAAIHAQVMDRVAQEEAEYGTGQGEPGKNGGFFSDLNLADFDTGRFLDEEPPRPEWVLQDALLAGACGFVVGHQGAGKSRFLLQLGAAVATGHTGFLGTAFRPAKKGRVLAVFCEETRPVLWRRERRMFNAFCPKTAASDGGPGVDLRPHPAEPDFRGNFIGIAAAGADVRLIQTAKGDAEPSQNFHELLTLAKSIPGLTLVILDPLSRLFGGNENDNAQATVFCSLLEKLAVETGAAVLVCAHTTKGVAKRKDGSLDLAAALHQDAMRGASAFSGAARFQVNLCSLPGKTARTLGVARDAADGQFVAGRSCKVSEGPEGQTFYLRRESGGTLRHVEAERAGQDKAIEVELIERITAEVRRREEVGEPALTLKALGDVFPARWKVDLPGATKAAVRAAAQAAILDGALFEITRRGRNNHAATYLATAPDVSPDAGQDAPSGDVRAGQRAGRGSPDSAGQKACPATTSRIDAACGAGQRSPRTEGPSGPGTRMDPSPDGRTGFPSIRGEDACPASLHIAGGRSKS